MADPCRELNGAVMEIIRRGADATRARKPLKPELKEQLFDLFSDVEISTKMLKEVEESSSWLYQKNLEFSQLCDSFSDKINSSRERLHFFMDTMKRSASYRLGALLLPLLSMSCSAYEVISGTTSLGNIRLIIFACTCLCDAIVVQIMKRLQDMPLHRISGDVQQLLTISRSKNWAVDRLATILNEDILSMAELYKNVPALPAWCVIVDELYDAKKDVCQNDAIYPNLFFVSKAMVVVQCLPILLEYKLQKKMVEQLIEVRERAHKLRPVFNYFPFFGALSNFVLSEMNPIVSVGYQFCYITYNRSAFENLALDQNCSDRISHYIERNAGILEQYYQNSILYE